MLWLYKIGKGEQGLKTFFDSVFISGSSLYEETECPIKLEYYKTIEMEENVEAKYGIEVIKTEFREGKVNVESEKLEKITNNQEKVDKLLTILRNNTVTPFGIQDILDEAFIQL